MSVTKRPARNIPRTPGRQIEPRNSDLAALALIVAAAIVLVTVGNASTAALTAASGFIVAVYGVWRRGRP